MKGGGRLVRQDRARLVAALPWEKIALQVQPGGHLVLEARLPVAHVVHAAPHPLQIAGSDQPVDIRTPYTQPLRRGPLT